MTPELSWLTMNVLLVFLPVFIILTLYSRTNSDNVIDHDDANFGLTIALIVSGVIHLVMWILKP